DVSEIVNSLFGGLSLNDPEYDEHFKKGFLYRFINRNINRQTVESFKLVLLSTFLTSESYINRIYNDVDKYLTQTFITEGQNKQINKQETDGSTTTDNRSAYAELPQSNVQLDVDSTIMNRANDNTISRNKQRNNQVTDGETETENMSENKTYRLDE